MVRPRVFMDVSRDGTPLGRIIYELFDDLVPKTVENFRALCTGEKGTSQASGKPLYYKNSPFHRVIDGFMIQGGDFTKGTGSGGESIFGGQFDDEDLSGKLDTEGLLCMANRGKNTNGSQFFITLSDCSHLNGVHVVFGRVIRGFEDVVAKIAKVEVDEKHRPFTPIIVSNCGELELRSKPQPPKRTSPSPERERSRKRKSRKRSSSRSGRSDSESESERRRRKKNKKRSKKHRSDKEEPAPEEDQAPRKETEEEYDARLEREENERIAAQRKEKLRKAKEQLELDAQSSKGGVRFKGRGRMVYIDPELRR
ncbi:cyclophilin-like domain-containing protein [Flagelloscypha sp. PMI_526]|nr:cyclophilin-like domain-containing protein [Flagelloscypha sp. PMI_526]